MWDCEACGCMQIAASITACPTCHTESYGLEKYGPPHKARPKDELVVEEVKPVKEVDDVVVPVP